MVSAISCIFPFYGGLVSEHIRRLVSEHIRGLVSEHTSGRHLSLSQFEARARELGETSAVLRHQRDELQRQRANVAKAQDALRTQADSFDAAVAGGAVEKAVGPPVSVQLQGANVRPPSGMGMATTQSGNTGGLVRPSSGSGSVQPATRSVFAAAAQQALTDGTRTRAELIGDLAARQVRTRGQHCKRASLKRKRQINVLWLWVFGHLFDSMHGLIFCLPLARISSIHL